MLSLSFFFIDWYLQTKIKKPIELKYESEYVALFKKYNVFRKLSLIIYRSTERLRYLGIDYCVCYLEAAKKLVT